GADLFGASTDLLRSSSYFLGLNTIFVMNFDLFYFVFHTFEFPNLVPIFNHCQKDLVLAKLS
ncbi:MAG: hypothetical protein Q8761_03345, partial [Sweet potato little leaf phytoplasma]|nr:hypothetical protein [Sweet potato little leaf phytoplasma]